MPCISEFKVPGLPKNLVVEFCDRPAFDQGIAPIWDDVFPEGVFSHTVQLNARDKKRRKALRDSFYDNSFTALIIIRVKKTGRPVGWVSGEQHDTTSFYVRNSGMIPSYRRKGIYSKVHDALMRHLEGLGYERVLSDHHPNNRPMLLYKIARGYMIHSMTFDERFGPLVRLALFIKKYQKEKFFQTYKVPQY